MTTSSGRHDDVSRCRDKSVAVDRELAMWVRLAINAETKHNYIFIINNFHISQQKSLASGLVFTVLGISTNVSSS